MTVTTSSTSSAKKNLTCDSLIESAALRVLTSATAKDETEAPVTGLKILTLLIAIAVEDEESEPLISPSSLTVPALFSMTKTLSLPLGNAEAALEPIWLSKPTDVVLVEKVWPLVKDPTLSESEEPPEAPLIW